MASTSAGTTRVDKWLWAVRLYKTRSDATEACRAGHVRVNDVSAKPATLVRPGDMLRALNASGEHIVEVTGLLEKRASASVAATCYLDHTPAPAPAEERARNFERERGAGRPTKRDRRQLDRLRRG